uniref:Uncharacterized protein n=1 Tax=Allomyces macrogynus (strain ATCC 38327) TaxID=578462 RepID=A0A0L0T711_ALLM3|nr:hypothetical protein AMAG_14589 [Allomyces macrogynus ATCC 38327]|eukprot:KNE70461.1 hypothetical protein AMAG_14589 [Allomyces macrogynus ATCC 38327]
MSASATPAFTPLTETETNPQFLDVNGNPVVASDPDPRFADQGDTFIINDPVTDEAGNVIDGGNVEWSILPVPGQFGGDTSDGHSAATAAAPHQQDAFQGTGTVTGAENHGDWGISAWQWDPNATTSGTNDEFSGAATAAPATSTGAQHHFEGAGHMDETGAFVSPPFV